jgi:Big-like domain-containing protein
MARMVSCALRISPLTLCLAALCPATAFPQVDSDVSTAATPATPAAYVYVGTTKGVYLYNAASNGSLSLVSGSPFFIAGSSIGSNGKYFVSLGTAYLHSYPVASNGAIKGQASQINTQLYSGSECGTELVAVLDHTGQDVYVQHVIQRDQETCNALQSFKIASTGAFSFLGATQFATEGQTGIDPFTTLIKLSGNGSYAYSASLDHECDLRTWELKRESSGAMLLNSYEFLTVPSSPPPQDWRWRAWVVTADPTNHLAVAMTGNDPEPGPCGNDHLTQLASFTVASDGSLTTTNTPERMPTPQVHPEVLNMSPSGQFLAVGGEATLSEVNGNGTQTPGLQVFHFNGANPITSYSRVLTTAPISEIRWDKNNHLYALSSATKKLYAYTVTSSNITAVPGSPYTIAASPNSSLGRIGKQGALVVVPISAACSAPASNGVHICAPTNGSSVSSPVTVKAASTVSGTIARMELWVDGVKKYTTTSSKQLSTTISLAAGSHRFSVFAINTVGQKWQSAVTATVK